MSNASITALVCRNHPELEAVDVCRTCTSRVCLECSQEVGSATFCADCASDANGPASRGAIVSLVLSAIGLFVPLVGLGGLILGHNVLNAINRGQSPAAGEKWAKAGVMLGWMNLATSCIAGMALRYAY